MQAYLFVAKTGRWILVGSAVHALAREATTKI
jgi:hypothetical protein